MISKSLVCFICEHARSEFDKKKALVLLQELAFSIAEYDIPRNTSIEQQIFVVLGFLAGPAPIVASPANQLLIDEFHRIFQLEKTKRLDQLVAAATENEDEDEDVRALARLTKKIAQKLNRRATPY